jgi:hypothetical protein
VVGQRLGLLHEVRGEQHGDAVATQRVDQLPHQPAALRVQARGGLVEEHQLRPADQRARQREPLLLPTRQPLVGRSGAAAQTQDVDEPRRVERVRGAGGDQPQHLLGAHPRVGAATLRHDADPGP